MNEFDWQILTNIDKGVYRAAPGFAWFCLRYIDTMGWVMGLWRVGPWFLSSAKTPQACPPTYSSGWCLAQYQYQWWITEEEKTSYLDGKTSSFTPRCISTRLFYHLWLGDDRRECCHWPTIVKQSQGPLPCYSGAVRATYKSTCRIGLIHRSTQNYCYSYSIYLLSTL